MKRYFELEPWMIRHGTPDPNPTVCARCGREHSRISVFCSPRCRRAWNMAKRREDAKKAKAAKIEELL